MKNRNHLVLGLMLILAGAVVLLGQMGVLRLSWATAWPLILVGLGIMFHLFFLVSGGRASGHLVPGGVLLTLGLLFEFCALNGWGWMSSLWPVAIIAPGIGLMESGLLGGSFSRHQGEIIAGAVLLLVGGLMLAMQNVPNAIRFVLPAGLIAAGLLVLISGLLAGRSRRQGNPYQDGPTASYTAPGASVPPEYVAPQRPMDHPSNPENH